MVTTKKPTDVQASDARAVATVNGVSISDVEVTALSEALAVQPREALQRLIEKELLAHEGARRGFDEMESVTRAARQASVQSLLFAEVENVSISDAEVADAYQRQYERFNIPVRRDSLHVLVVVKEHDSKERQRKAGELARKILGELQRAPDPRAVWETYKKTPEMEAFKITAEEVPGLARDGAAAPKYLEGLYSRPDTGVVAAPWQTSFGWHAIVVTKIIPGETHSLAEVRETLRAELLAERQRSAFEDLVADAKKRHRVTVDEAAIQKALQEPAPSGTTTP